MLVAFFCLHWSWILLCQKKCGVIPSIELTILFVTISNCNSKGNNGVDVNIISSWLPFLHEEVTQNYVKWEDSNSKSLTCHSSSLSSNLSLLHSSIVSTCIKYLLEFNFVFFKNYENNIFLGLFSCQFFFFFLTLLDKTTGVNNH